MSNEIESAYQYCESVTKTHAKSFYFAAKFLPKLKRRAVYPIYAFCRHVDDEIDEIGERCDASAAVRAVEKWKRQLEEVFENKKQKTNDTNEGDYQKLKTKIALILPNSRLSRSMLAH